MYKLMTILPYQQQSELVAALRKVNAAYWSSNDVATVGVKVNSGAGIESLASAMNGSLIDWQWSTSAHQYVIDELELLVKEQHSSK